LNSSTRPWTLSHEIICQQMSWKGKLPSSEFRTAAQQLHPYAARGWIKDLNKCSTWKWSWSLRMDCTHLHWEVMW
jgi:hypothetical protein